MVMRKMKRFLLVIVLIHLSQVQFGQIIADHTVVDQYDKIPQQYIDEVKKMRLVIASESHGSGYTRGLILLEELDPKYASHFNSAGTPSSPTTVNLRVDKATWGDINNETGWIHSYGEEDWFTSAEAIARTKDGILYSDQSVYKVSAMGFGWCYDAVANNGTTQVDPDYGMRWFGNSKGGAEGDIAWGIDASDHSTTGNSISMDTYLDATQDYIDFCSSNNIDTHIFFTTGPVDDYSAEARYQGHLKYEYIRAFVKEDVSRVLFDYADILCYDNDGSLTTDAWNGNTFPTITATNGRPIEIGHISEAGALRLAKAMWWMLARLAGWDGVATDVEEAKGENSIPHIWVKNNEIVIEMNELSDIENICLLDVQGKKISEQKVKGNVCRMSTAGMVSGIYLVHLKGPSGTMSKKIVVR
jgi:hypothetical protein